MQIMSGVVCGAFEFMSSGGLGILVNGFNLIVKIIYDILIALGCAGVGGGGLLGGGVGGLAIGNIGGWFTGTAMGIIGGCIGGGGILGTIGGGIGGGIGGVLGMFIDWALGLIGQIPRCFEYLTNLIHIW